MNGPCPGEATGVDPQESPNEELINVRRTFLEEEEDEYTKSSRRYLQDEENYINRIKTYNVWVKKPAHLCSLLLARNGFICENESTVSCEMCRCKFVYEKDTYSMYTTINDLCLLHLKNCPWKGKLIDLQILHLDGESLKKDNLLREYQSVTTFLQNGTHDVPYIDIKKTISNLILIVKKHLANESSKKKFLPFNSYVELFKSHYVEIFKSHKNLVYRGMHLIRSNYKHMMNHLVDEAFLNNLTYDPLDVHTYINIVADVNANAEKKLSHSDEDLNMYFKIVNQLKNFEYEDVNIYKLIALLGWTYRTSPRGEDPDVPSQILYCRYCFREVNLGDYSTFSRRQNKIDLFKSIHMEPPGEVADPSIDDARDALERLTGLADGWVEVEEGENDEDEDRKGEERDSEVRGGAEREGEEKGAEDQDATGGEVVEIEATEKEAAEKEATEKEATEKEVVEKEQEENPGEEINGEANEGEENLEEQINRGENEGEEKQGEGNNGGEKEDNQNVSNDTKGDPNEGGDTKDLPTQGGRDGQANPEEQEGFSFKWSIKQFFLPKKSIDNADKNQDAGDASPGECPVKSVNQGALTPNGKGNPVCGKKRRKKYVQLKNILSRAFLEVSSYTEDENLFSKAAHDCYVLKGGPHLAHLDNRRTPKEDDKEAANCTDAANGTDNTVPCGDTAGTTQKRTIRAFNLIENHRSFCPYMTEDLYSFSKITKLLFELVTSEFQRRYVMR
ncbi:hypothetical protein C922_01337 [Plasmodium inui San Antonio 1]|uniref:C3HC-type domain-containing protein n=1 Tax=Plasmodium inui San Antonio 1 TaxID=1237626 RepID=W7A5C5_9APIC|nr:hypothetical protein C922_01337 [Plasmodium inui San Antonio 1]EUD68317.1 hypothetical protein C922_01337 [Plasmodium inui San Antonio 1]